MSRSTTEIASGAVRDIEPELRDLLARLSNAIHVRLLAAAVVGLLLPVSPMLAAYSFFLGWPP